MSRETAYALTIVACAWGGQIIGAAIGVFMWRARRLRDAKAGGWGR